jgi:hypothetical protein
VITVSDPIADKLLPELDLGTRPGVIANRRSRGDPESPALRATVGLIHVTLLLEYAGNVGVRRPMGDVVGALARFLADPLAYRPDPQRYLDLCRAWSWETQGRRLAEVYERVLSPIRSDGRVAIG